MAARRRNAIVTECKSLNGFWRRAKDGARRADVLQATLPLGPEASKALLDFVGPVSLSETRRAELAALAEKAQEAFNRPWPERKSNQTDTM
jgi:hypothetical protein